MQARAGLGTTIKMPTAPDAAAIVVMNSLLVCFIPVSFLANMSKPEFLFHDAGRNHLLIRNEIENAVRLQACGYQFLRWLDKALADEFISPEAAGTYATSEDAAYSWLDRHYLNLPEKARPERSDLRAFSNFFSTGRWRQFAQKCRVFRLRLLMSETWLKTQWRDGRS
jgi:hypothetical protein